MKYIIRILFTRIFYGKENIWPGIIQGKRLNVSFTANQQGNALFLILIAVALFATLSYAVTQSGRGGGNISKEQASLNAARIVQYGAGLKSALDRMRILNNVGENEISFYNTVHKKNGGDLRHPTTDFPNCLSTYCELFSTDGGYATPVIFGKDAILVDSAIPSGATLPGHSRFISTTVLGVGTTKPELVLTVLFLKPEVCKAINNLSDIPNDGDSVPIDPIRVSGSYSGYQNDLGDTDSFTIGDDYAPFHGQTSFCVHWNDSGAGLSDFDYVYFHVLIER